MPPRPWLQVVTLEVGLSKLSSVTGPCVQCVHAGRTQSNLLILIRLSAAGDCEALRGTLDAGDTRAIPSTSYRVPTVQLYPVGGRHEKRSGGGGGAQEGLM